MVSNGMLTQSTGHVQQFLLAALSGGLSLQNVASAATSAPHPTPCTTAQVATKLKTLHPFDHPNGMYKPEVRAHLVYAPTVSRMVYSKMASDGTGLFKKQIVFWYFYLTNTSFV